MGTEWSDFTEEERAPYLDAADALIAAEAQLEAMRAQLATVEAALAAERDAAVTRAIEAERRADEYGKLINECGYIADVVVFSSVNFPMILENLRGFRIEAEQGRHDARRLMELRERLQFDPGGSDRIDELEMAIDMLRTRAEAAEVEVERLRAEAEHLRALLSEGVEIVDSLSAGFGVWTEAAGRALGGER